MENISPIFQQLGAHRHLDREKALMQFKQSLKQLANNEYEQLEQSLVELIDNPRWEMRQGALKGVKVLLDTIETSEKFRTEIIGKCKLHLEDVECRVRIAVGDVLEILTQKYGIEVYLAVSEALLGSVRHHFSRSEAVNEGTEEFSQRLTSQLSSHEDADVESAVQLDGTQTLDAEEDIYSPVADEDDPCSEAYSGSYTSVDCSEAGAEAAEDNTVNSLYNCSDRDAVKRIKRTALRPDTEGWRSLETTFRALKLIVAAAGPGFFPHINSDFLRLLYRACSHTNRFVRESGYETCAAIALAADLPTLTRIADEVSLCISQGLMDNWSQVRYSASVAVRAFMLKASDEIKDQYGGRLFPKMMLNRHYQAVGVKTYSLQTWQMVMADHASAPHTLDELERAAGAGPLTPAAEGGASTEKTKGQCTIEKLIEPTVGFFITQANADNHAVREAACLSIAELGTKLSSQVLGPFVPSLLQALLLCFADMSWPVRDAACVACAEFIQSHGDAARGSLDLLYQHWWSGLRDNIWSIREHSAMALGTAMTVYGDEAVAEVLNYLDKNILAVHQQREESAQNDGLTNETVFGVAMPKPYESGPIDFQDTKKRRDNDPALHEHVPVYSCGSLAPKLQKSACGCSGAGIRRSAQPWEVTDGCLFLVRELALVKPDKAAPFLQKMADVALCTHFINYYNMLETLWKQIPVIMKAVGKRPFKRYMDFLLPGLERALSSENRLAQAAAGVATAEMMKFVGPSIFKGHCEDSLLDAIDRCEFVLHPPASPGGPIIR